jgi:hypothetical protein
VAIGDMNGGGKPDLVVANYGSNTVSVLLNTGAGTTTPTLLAQFGATTSDGGIELRWSFGDPGRVISVEVERASWVVGPWEPITPELREEIGVTIALDRTADPGRVYYYRLIVTLVGGTDARFGPVSSSVSANIAESAITRLAPNPTSGGTQIEFAIARGGRVRIVVLDVLGREVATLVDASYRPGRYVAVWGGDSRGGRLPAELYFVRLKAPDRTLVRKLARIH